MTVASAFLAASVTAYPQTKPISRIAQLSQADDGRPHAVDLEATVWTANPRAGALVISDDSGAVDLRADWSGNTFQPGDRVAVTGEALITDFGDSLELRSTPIVDNDGLHGEEERSGSIHLEAGLHPLRLQWFNAIGEPGLIVEYEGPGIPRERFPLSASDEAAPLQLFVSEDSLQRGFSFRSFRGRWWALPPNMSALSHDLAGIVPGFDVSVAQQKEFVGIEFSGYIEIPTSGAYTFHLLSDDGSRLFLGAPSLALQKIASGTELPLPAPVAPGQVLTHDKTFQYSTVEGTVVRIDPSDTAPNLSLDSGVGLIHVEFADSKDLPWRELLDRSIRATGALRRSRTLEGIPIAGTLFAQDAKSIELLSPLSETPVLTPIEAIERFDSARIADDKNVRIQGVVTNSIAGGYAIVLQDSSRAIFVDLNRLRPKPIQTGDLLEISGEVRAGEFSPFIDATALRRLGSGVMPKPLEATRDEIINGSLHSQYAEIEGFVLAMDRRSVTLRTRAGVLNIDLEVAPSADWLNAVLRLRGCLRSFWDPVTREVEVGKLELNSAEIEVVRPAPADLFHVSRKQASELLRFDPNASAFQRVRLVAQVALVDGAQLYLMDQNHGLRATLAEKSQFARGDVVEIAGFPEFDGPSPHFAHSIARKLETRPLPSPRSLDPENPLDDRYDATLVSVEGELVGMGIEDESWTLQIRSGSTVFAAPIISTSSRKPRYELGSRLRLVGVYSGLGGSRALGLPIDAFELMVASPADVAVVATPPWWTMPRLLTLVGALCVVLLAALLWIKSLQRQVAAKTDQLKSVLEERHRVEQEEALASERSRLAYDLHDELGAGLTEVGLLGTLAAAESLPSEKRQSHLARLSDKVRHLVMSLDEIVWAVNPKYDSLSSFVSYYTFYAQQFLELANVRCRFDVAEDLPEEPLTSRVRHSLFLCFKEALTNVARHAHATEVVIRIRCEDRQLAVSISDNGCGLRASIQNPGTDGLASISERLDNLGGSCELQSGEGHGTTVRLMLPLQ